ncbi:DUF58 domain-containing protein [Flavihumibacter sp. UBA7668]|uniref:DUF58 domain-containing protein n=1 Tax=Flavihumibacter sp. UBA7668 TaxID=1946542 RepID=UPI0025BCD8DB|nr:DUF58 domain-containing protein [Flavihumibacter sp. UBA7668]
MLTTSDILKKVKELEIKSKRLTRHLFTGEYHSAFKGRGMSFKEVREYHAGDDIRFIDWNVSARFNATFSKLFEEERELTVVLLVDISASSLFGTVHARKKDLVTEIGAVLSFSAISNNDKVGAILFTEGIELYVPPKKGRDHGLFIVRELLTKEGLNKGTDLTQALRFLNNTTRQKCIVFVLSDFLDPNFADALRVAGKKHDVVGIKVYDPMDMNLPDIGLLDLEDAETGAIVTVDTSDFRVRKAHHDAFFQHTEWAKQAFNKAGCDLLHISTREDYVKVLQKFFIGRA